jgi:leucyl/phenylalanyl-tRNA--protein transferase
LRTVLRGPYEVSVDRDFPAVIAACATSMPGREDTWINRDIERLFSELHRMGHAHSVECRAGGTLVGGLYGVSLGGAFFGESMFSTARDASKVALVHLVARLRVGGFRLLDTQFVTSHLQQFGTEEIPRDRYKALLAAAVDEAGIWQADSAAIEAEIRSMANRDLVQA